MKRIGKLLEKIADIDNLRLATWKAAKGKRYATKIIEYQQDMDANLLLLRKQILSGNVDVGNYHYFKIYDPKERDICASAFKEQVLHHAMMNVCHDFFERKQIYDSYASRKGKGTYAALERAKKYTKQYDFFLKLDVRKFFASIDHEILKKQLAAMFKDVGVLTIFNKIINSYEDSSATGLPIGNLSSQYFANHYLSGLDHFAKEKLRVAYVRYMDDMILWHGNKDVLKKAFFSVREYIEEQLALTLKPKLLNHSKLGLPFLSYIVFPYDVKLGKRSRKRFVIKMKKMDKKYHSGIWDEATCQHRGLSLVAFTQHANAKKWRKNVLLRL